MALNKMIPHRRGRRPGRVRHDTGAGRVPRPGRAADPHPGAEDARRPRPRGLLQRRRLRRRRRGRAGPRRAWCESSTAATSATRPSVGRAVEAASSSSCGCRRATSSRCCAAAAPASAAFSRPSASGTAVEAGHEAVTVDGRAYLWEKAVRADVAFVRAHAGDTFGNLCFRGTSRNYNTTVATCADYVIAEVEHAYSVGELDPEKVHAPGVFVDAVVRADVTLLWSAAMTPGSPGRGRGAAAPPDAAASSPPAPLWSSRTARSPTSAPASPCSSPTTSRRASTSSSRRRTGSPASGPVSPPGTEDPDRRNAGNLFVTLLPGGCYFDTATSFAMIRGGHVAATMLGTLQVDGDGNIANYEMPGRKIGMGGAMDLVAGARTVYVLTEHCTKDGVAEAGRRCTLPLTGAGECDVIITERGAVPPMARPRLRPRGGGLRPHAGGDRRLHRDGVLGGGRREAGRLRRGLIAAGAARRRPGHVHRASAFR